MAAPRIIIVGGGAAGFFAAITAAETNPAARVVLYEATAHPLAKVRVSGGGRCNATHACPEPRELVKRYPRGARELLGPFTRFGPRDTIAWFAERGVELKTEPDGRMFPVTDSSATIIDCLRGAADRAGVKVFTAMGVRAVEPIEGGQFAVEFTDSSTGEYDRVLLATGGNKGSVGLTIAAELGHEIKQPVPSLFTFHIDDPRIRGLEGLSVPDVTTAARGTKLRERGPILVTHWGMSGPAVLKLSAWGARELAARDYKFTLEVSWTGGTLAEAEAALAAMRTEAPRKLVNNTNPWTLPSRLWERLTAAAGIAPETQWAGVSKKSMQALAGHCAAAGFEVEGKSLN
ncbi:MAG: aminoacetone oxidase family FAD-binding enzyme, partial [Verrucomicrobiota bacterium]